MGLDQYAYKILNFNPESPIGFEDDFHKREYEELYTWRKNYELQTWMINLYIAKGGKDEFNCNLLLLTMDDIINLEQWLNENNNTDEYTFTFCKLSIEAINEGYKIIYDSWW